MTAPVRSGEITDLEELIHRLMALPPCKYMDPPPADFNPAEGRCAQMNCAVLTDARAELPVAGTESLASCMGVAVFNPITQTGGVVHLAQSAEDPERLSDKSRIALLALLAASREDPSHMLEVRLAGPRNYGGNVHVFLRDVAGVLNDQPNLLFLSADMLDKPSPSSFAMDTRRWNDGLIKGSAGIDMNEYRQTSPEGFAAAIQEDNRLVVEAVEKMPDAPSTPTGLYDMRQEKRGAGQQLTDEQLDELVHANPDLAQTIEFLKAARKEGKLPS